MTSADSVAEPARGMAAGPLESDESDLKPGKVREPQHAGCLSAMFSGLEPVPVGHMGFGCGNVVLPKRDRFGRQVER